MHTSQTTQDFSRQFTYFRIFVDWENKLYLRQGFVQPFYSTEDIGHRFPLIFSAMCRNQYFRCITIQKRLNVFISKPIPIFYSSQKRINHRITCYKNMGVIYIFFQQISARLRCRRKMQCCHRTGQFTVGFFRIRRIHISGTQPRLYMSYRNLLIKRSQGSSECSSSIPMHQHQIRLFFLQNFF